MVSSEYSYLMTIIKIIEELEKKTMEYKNENDINCNWRATYSHIGTGTGTG